MQLGDEQVGRAGEVLLDGQLHDALELELDDQPPRGRRIDGCRGVDRVAGRQGRLQLRPVGGQPHCERDVLLPGRRGQRLGVREGHEHRVVDGRGAGRTQPEPEIERPAASPVAGRQSHVQRPVVQDAERLPSTSSFGSPMP